jgi:hypothetical protein
MEVFKGPMIVKTAKVIVASNENSLCECACICGKGKFKVSFRIYDKGREGVEHFWEISCIHCRGLYDIEQRGNLIGVVKKTDEIPWEHEVKEMGRVKSKKLFHKPKFIRIIYEINDANIRK